MQSVTRQTARVLPQMGKQGVCVCVHCAGVAMLTILQFFINSVLSIDERRLAGNRRRWRHGGRDQGTKDAHREANGLPEEAARQDAAGQAG